MPLANPLILALKAGLAVTFALTFVRLAGLSDSLSAGFASLVCTTPVVMTGVRRGWEQLVASVVGGTVSWALLVALPNQPWVTGLAVTGTVLVIFRTGLAQTFLIAGFTVLYVFILPAETPGFALEQRLFSLACGIAAATLVNVGISAAFYRSIFQRRVRLVRRAVADCFPRLANLAAAPDRTFAPVAFDPVFPVLWSLGAELSDALKETRWRRIDHAAVLAHHEAVRRLAALAHVGRELGHEAERSDESAHAVAAAARHLERLLVEGVEPPDFDGADALGPTWQRAVDAARAAYTTSIDAVNRPLDVVS